MLEEPIKVYNFQVEDFHTYYVGTDVSVLVHNDCPNGNKKSSTYSNENIETKRTPAQVYADEVQGLPSKERPNTVAVIETKDGQIIKSHNSENIYNQEVQETLNSLGNENDFGRQCAEVNGVSKAKNNGINLEGSTISVANVRGPNSDSGIHGTPKKPCNVCQPMLDAYGIKYIE